MNANEVIANRALEILGHPRGDYHIVHPLEHVNLGQSTNDVYPTAVKVALGFASRSLEQALRGLAERCSTKALEFGDMLKLGRTQLQDAVPMTLGQEFGAFAVTIGEDADRLGEASHADRRDQPRRHRDRHRTQRTPRIRSTGVRSTPPPHRPAAEHRRQPRRGHLRRRRLRPTVRCHQTDRREAVEDLQRPAAAVLGPACRLQRDQSPARAGGLQHHAGQSEPRHPGSGQPGCLRGDRQRPHRHHGRRGRATTAQRLRTDHRPCAAVLAQSPHGRGKRLGRALHSGNHREPRTHA